MQTLLASTELKESFLFALQKLNDINLCTFKPFFDNLPADPYIHENYRFRRLSRFRVAENQLIKLSHGYLFQSKKYNPLVGDVKREFAEIEEGIIETEDFKQLLFIFSNYCQGNSQLGEIAVHQIRTTCKVNNVGNPAPEGIHRDGVEILAIFAVARDNIIGGETHLYKSKKESPVFSQVLNPGELLWVNDRQFFHFTTPIQVKSEFQGTRDVFVLTCPSLLSE